MQSGSKGEQLLKMKFIHHIEATSLEYLRCKNKLGCEKFWLILARTPYSSQVRLPPPPNQTLPPLLPNEKLVRTPDFEF